MERHLPDIRSSWLRLLLRPIVRFCIRHGVTVQQLVENVKSLSVELAAEEMRASSDKVTVSRLSVLTGLQRRDISRMLREETSEPVVGSLATRVLGYWENNKRYKNKSNNLPRSLSVEEFRALVSKVSTDVNPATILFNLERMGAITKNSNGRVELIRSRYIPQEDPTESFRILERDCEDLIQTVEQNVLQPEKPRQLHGRTEFDNISRAHLDEIRKWLRSEGTLFHQRVRQYLSQFDLDINPELKGSGGAYVALGTFGRIIEERQRDERQKEERQR